MKQSEENRKENKMAQILFIYMRMVERLQSFAYASRNRDWLLHLESGKQLLQDYCSMDRTKYRRLMPVYIANMYALKETDPLIWEAFMNGEFCVKKSQIRFTGNGVDHGGEQVIKTLIIEGGLVGIANNENARLRFFLTAPLLANIAQDVKSISQGNSTPRKRHHLDSSAATTRHREMHTKLLGVLKEKSAIF